VGRENPFRAPAPPVRKNPFREEDGPPIDAAPEPAATYLRRQDNARANAHVGGGFKEAPEQEPAHIEAPTVDPETKVNILAKTGWAPMPRVFHQSDELTRPERLVGAPSKNKGREPTDDETKQALEWTRATEEAGLNQPGYRETPHGRRAEAALTEKFATKAFDELFPGMSPRDARLMSESIEVWEANAMIKETRKVAGKSDLDRARAVQVSLSLERLLGQGGHAANGVKTAAQAKILVKELAEFDAEFVERNRFSLFAQNTASDLGKILSFGMADPRDLASESRKRALAGEAETRGFIGKAVGAAVTLTPAITTIGGLGKLFTAGAQKFGLSAGRAGYLGNASAMGVFSVSQGGKFGEGFTFGALAPGVAHIVGKVLFRTPHLFRYQAGIAEGIGFLGAGGAVHGWKVDQGIIDLAIGMAIGAAKGKSALEVKIKRAHAKWEAAKTPEAREAASAEVRKIVEDAVAAEQAKTTKVETPTEVPPVRLEGKAEAAPEAATPGSPKAPKTPPVAEGEAGDLSFLTGTQLRVVEAKRAERGVEPLPEKDPVSTQARQDAAEATVSFEAAEPHRIVKRLLNESDPSISVKDDAILKVHAVNLEARLRDAHARGARAKGDKTELAEAAAEKEQVLLEMAEADMANAAVSRGWGQLGRQKQVLLRRDYSLTAMIQKRAAANGYKLSDAQVDRIVAQRTKLDRVEAAKARESELKAKEAHRELMGQMEALKAQVARGEAKATKATPADVKAPKWGAKNKMVTRKAADAADARLRAKWSKGLRQNLDPTDVKDFATRVAFHVEAGVRGLADATRVMVSEWGDKIKPHMKALYAEAQKLLQPDTVGKMKAAAEKGRPVLEMERHVSQLVYEIAERGVTKYEPMLKELHAELKKVDPQITMEETKTAFTQYGKSTPYAPDPYKAQADQWRIEVRETQKQASMERGEAPLATGKGRPKPGPRAREEKAKTHQMKKEGDFHTPAERAGVLQSAQAAIRSRLKNSMDAMWRQLRIGKRDARKEGRPDDAETAAVRVSHAEVKAHYDSGLGKPGMSAEARANVAVKAAQRSLDAIDARIKAYEKSGNPKDLLPGQKVSEPLSDARVDAIRTERDARQAVLNELQAIANPKRTKREIALKAKETRLLNKIFDVMTRRAQKDYAKRKKAEPVESERTKQLDAYAQRVMAEFNRDVIADHLKNRHIALKVADALIAQPLFLLKTFFAGLDQSYIGRQGVVQTALHPIRTLTKTIPTSFRVMKSEAPRRKAGQSQASELADRVFKRTSKEQAKAEARIKAMPLYKNMIDGGLEFAEHGQGARLSARSEDYQGRWGERIPGFGATQRSYNTGGNEAKAMEFNFLAKYGSGTSNAPTRAEARVFAHFINVTTGRPAPGKGKLSQAVAGLGSVMWAPRLAFSRFLFLAAEPVWGPRSTKAADWFGYKGTLKARGIIAFETARFYTAMAVIYRVLEELGAETPFTPGSTFGDPGSTNWLKFKIGDQTYDPAGGFGQAWTFIYRMWNDTKTTASGNKITLSDPDSHFGGATHGDVAGRYFRSKLNPVLGMLWNIKTGQDYRGRPATLGSELREIAPLAFKDVYTAYRNQGLDHKTALTMIALFGVGVNTWEQSPEKGGRRKKVKKKRKKKQRAR